MKKLLYILYAGILASPLYASAQGLTDGKAYKAFQKGAGVKADDTDVFKFIENGIAYLLTFLGILLVIYFLYAGFLWMTAGGESGQVKKAKDIMQNATVGLVIIFSARVLAFFVLGALAQAFK
jgi:hypothetical protein